MKPKRDPFIVFCWVMMIFLTVLWVVLQYW